MSQKTLLFSYFAAVLLLLTTGMARAENSQDFGDYVVHFNALSTDLLPSSVTKQYGIKRSKNRGMINIAVLRKVLGTAGEPVVAKLDVSATNLTGQGRDIEVREVREGTAIYYIGEFPVTHEETLRFSVSVKLENADETFEVRFKQQFFTH
jgi:hypothetical protein